MLGDLTITQEDALKLLENLPEGLNPDRKAVIEKALTLVGKVNYFWGGKSNAIGWDSRWGTMQKSQLLEVKPQGLIDRMAWIALDLWIGSLTTPWDISLATVAVQHPSMIIAHRFPGQMLSRVTWSFMVMTAM